MGPAVPAAVDLPLETHHKQPPHASTAHPENSSSHPNPKQDEDPGKGPSLKSKKNQKKIDFLRNESTEREKEYPTEKEKGRCLKRKRENFWLNIFDLYLVSVWSSLCSCKKCGRKGTITFHNFITCVTVEPDNVNSTVNKTFKVGFCNNLCRVFYLFRIQTSQV